MQTTDSTNQSVPLSELDLRLAAALAPMLLAVATFSLVLMTSQTNPHGTPLDELFALLSTLCLLGSATVADSVMDKYGQGIERFRFLGYGYFLFCLAVGTMTMAIPILYVGLAGHKPLLPWHYIVFFATGFSVVIKLQLGKEEAWTALMFGLYVATACISASLALG